MVQNRIYSLNVPFHPVDREKCSLRSKNEKVSFSRGFDKKCFCILRLTNTNWSFILYYNKICKIKKALNDSKKKSWNNDSKKHNLHYSHFFCIFPKKAHGFVCYATILFLRLPERGRYRIIRVPSGFRAGIKKCQVSNDYWAPPEWRVSHSDRVSC
jgi:hypothetical protein